MRHRRFVVLTFLAALGFSATPGEAQIAAAGGISIPTGELADEAENGYHWQGSAAFHPAVLPFGLRADLFYQSFKNVEREPGINVSLGGEWFRQLGLMLNAVYGIPMGMVEPYALVGGGWFREWHGDRSYSGTDHTTFNLNAGVGVDVSITDRLGLFLEARQIGLVSGKSLPLTPPAVQDEIKFKSVPITLGIRF